MIPDNFKAIRAEATAGNKITPILRELPLSSLPANEVLVRVHYSSLNYKDALSATGNRGITRNYPHTPGIDSCGTVMYSADPGVKKGDPVLVFGRDLGMNTPGGFGQYIQVPAEWVMPMPEGMSFRESMMLGTAGFTAALAIFKMEQNGQKPKNGPVLVTGAGGGLGSLAINILSQIGYQVIAATGKTTEGEYFAKLGAAEVIDRAQVNDQSGKLLLRPRWAGVVETVGGNVLSTAIRACYKHGNVAVCGNAFSHELNISVYPFILNGVNLLGIDSATSSMEIRKIIWERLANDWRPNMLEMIGNEITIDQLPAHIKLILKGKIRGRVVVNMK
ncbi:MAG: YhdH/YhfP family quinone oxidoreductase [Lentimicrobium sp.]|jgi:putative YhdH/YhfP family quinone oxidoreductase|nr:YhdH/YhfP family quinone oxidoreductase [Lentimicrobium sp.]